MILAFTLAWAAPPERVQIRYDVRFDLNALGDQLCAISKVCDCEARYAGEGTRAHTDPGRVSYQGRWTLESSTCADAFAVWVPADGAAWHSFHLTAEGRKLGAWVVHGAEGGHAQRSSDIKAHQQFWMDQLDAAWPGPVQVEQRDGSDLGMGVRVDATHTLSVQPLKGSPASR